MLGNIPAYQWNRVRTSPNNYDLLLLTYSSVLDDVVRVFHHPAIRDHGCELHENMFRVVEQWINAMPDRGANLNNTLSSESVKAGTNNLGGADHGHSQSHNPQGPGLGNFGSISSKLFGFGSGGKQSGGSAFGMLTGRELPSEGTGYDRDVGGSVGPYSDQGSTLGQSFAPPSQSYGYDFQPQPPAQGVNYNGPYQQASDQSSFNYGQSYQGSYGAPQQNFGQPHDGQSFGQQPPPPTDPYNYDRQWQGGSGY